MFKIHKPPVYLYFSNVLFFKNIRLYIIQQLA
jgi:hypothetical protein